MSLSANLPAAMLNAILTRLAVLFLAAANGDQAIARDTAAEMLAAYHPENGDELRLAAEIVGFSCHTLEALGQAANPEMPVNLTIRLRSGAVTLSRAAETAQKRLDRLQKARRAGAPTKAEAAKPQPQAEKAVALVEDTRKIAALAKATGQTWTQANAQREREKRLEARRKKNEAPIPHTSAPQQSVA